MSFSNEPDGTLGRLLLQFKQPIERLDSYLKENVHLFTLIGVFGALSGYLSSLPEVRSNPAMQKTGYVITFSLVILLSVVAYLKMYYRIAGSDFSILSAENAGITGFGVVFGAVLLLIGVLVSNFQTIWFPIVLSFVYLSGLAIGMGSLVFAANFLVARTPEGVLSARAITHLTLVGISIIGVSISVHTPMFNTDLIDQVAPGIGLGVWLWVSAEVIIAFATMGAIFMEIVLLLYGIVNFIQKLN